MSWSGFTVSVKLGTNLLTKFIFPRKDCMDLLLWGGGILEMASVLSGSIIIPYLDTMNPSSLPSSTTNTYFLGLSDIPYLLHLLKTFLRSE
jgi:hypothetical protein